MILVERGPAATGIREHTGLFRGTGSSQKTNHQRASGNRRVSCQSRQWSRLAPKPALLRVLPEMTHVRVTPIGRLQEQGEVLRACLPRCQWFQ
jgi:hypothetical protein